MEERGEHHHHKHESEREREREERERYGEQAEQLCCVQLIQR